MSHTKPYIRKKAVLIMYKVFLKYPESLRPAFPRLKEKLEDPDPGNGEQRNVVTGLHHYGIVTVFVTEKELKDLENQEDMTLRLDILL